MKSEEKTPFIKGAKIALVIEDDEDIQNILQAWLEIAGYTPVIVDSAEDALENAFTVARSVVVDVIILDYFLSGSMNGAEFVKELERRNRRNAPIMLFAATPHIARIAQEIHAEGFTQKPCNFSRLIDDLAILEKRWKEDHRIVEIR